MDESRLAAERLALDESCIWASFVRPKKAKVETAYGILKERISEIGARPREDYGVK